MTTLIAYISALAHNRPGTFAGLVMLFLICCMALFTAPNSGGRRW